MARSLRRKRGVRRQKRRKRIQYGGLDIQKELKKTGLEFHVPGYQYLGPGTKLKKRLTRGDQGIKWRLKSKQSGSLQQVE